MCRLLAQISAQARPCPELSKGPCSLLAQSDKDPARLQKDGWGIAVYGEWEGEPTVVKSPGAAFDEKGRFRKAAAPAARLAIAHIRHASNPRGLPRRRLLGLVNSQPFTLGRFAFAHNGTVNVPDELAADLEPSMRRRIRGINDSEVYFYQFLQHFKGDPERAFRDCVEQQWALRRPEGKKPHHGLNVVASDGARLFAFNHFPRTKKPALCSRRPYERMAFLDEGARLVVGSETQTSRWKSLRDPEVLVAWVSGGRVKHERRPVKLPKSILKEH